MKQPVENSPETSPVSEDQSAWPNKFFLMPYPSVNRWQRSLLLRPFGLLASALVSPLPDPRTSTTGTIVPAGKQPLVIVDKVITFCCYSYHYTIVFS
jgi:hypothetical protein